MNEQSTTASTPSTAAEALASLQARVTAGEEYRLRLPAQDSPEKAGPRALVAKIQFFNSSGAAIDGPYKGCFESGKFGQYLYLPTLEVAADVPWSEQSVRAPEAAATIAVSVHRWRASPGLKVAGELQVRGAHQPLLESEHAVAGGFPLRVYVGLADGKHSDRAAVVQVRFLDAAGSEMPGPYAGCNRSERFGEFTYVSTPRESAAEICLVLAAPIGAQRVRLTGHRWKGTAALSLRDPVRVVADVPQGLENTDEWIPVGPEGCTLPVSMPDGVAGRFALLQGEYVAQLDDDEAPAIRLVCEFLDADGSPIFDAGDAGGGVLAERLRVLGSTAEARPYACFIRCPAGAVSARLRAYPGEGARRVALHRHVSLAPLEPLHNTSRMDASAGAAQRLEVRRPAFAEWRLRLTFEGLRKVDPHNRDVELCIFFGDRKVRTLPLVGTDTKVQTGTLRTTGKSLYLKPRPEASGNRGVERLRGSMQILPPVGTESVVVRLTNTSGSEIPHRCLIEPCDQLAEDRLSATSASQGLRLEEASPDAARVMTERLLDLYPEDAAALGGAIDVYRRLGAATQMASVASRALALPKGPGKLRHKARHILASLEEQDPQWSIRIPGNWGGQQRERRQGSPLRVAHLFKTSVPYENTGGAIRCMNMVKFQKQAGMDPMVVTPLGYPGVNISGEPWECDDIEGVPHFRLNGIQRDDLRTIPSTRQLEYGALLTANLLREQGVDLVQASSGYRGYEQALVGLAVARKLGVPFVYEVRSYHEHTWRPMAEWVLESEFTKRRMAQEDRCMHEADAVVTICETMKKGLVARGIPEEKVFVVPNSVDLEKFKPRKLDPQLRTQAGLREGLVTGYISNVSAREGHHVLLRAVALARAGGTDLQCLIVGTGPELEKLKELARALGIADHVVFTGDIPHERIADYYGLIDMFVVPRVADFASDFVTPMKPFEAMALGGAVVVSDRPALREVVEPGVRGLEFRAGDAAHLAEKLQELRLSPELKERLSGAGQQWVKDERSWPTTIRRYEEIYEYAFRAHSSNRSPA